MAGERRVDTAEQYWQVGEVARRTGLTVRTLHHYDEIGLLSPSHRSPAGYRRYDAADLARLQQILSLRRLGFGLDEIGEVLRGAAQPLPAVLDLHRRRLAETIEAQQRLLHQLDVLAERIAAGGGLDTEELFTTMEVMAMVDRVEKYYTAEQREELRRRAEELGPDGIRAAEMEWPALIAAVRAAMEAGQDPASPDVQLLAGRWQALIDAFTGGNPEIAGSLQRMYEHEPEVREQAGLDPALGAYVGRMLAARQ